MRTTPVLYRIHIGRLIKKNWHQQGKLRFEESHARKVLAENKIKVYEPEELDEKPIENVRTNLLIPEDELPLDENHPDWKAEPCFIYKDNDVLLEGIDQARILCNALEISQLPSLLRKAEENVSVPDELHEEAKKRIKHSCIYDAYQELLPRRYSVEKPHYTLRREFGITNARKNQLLLGNLLHLCDQQSSSLNKSIMNNGFFTCPMRISNKLIQLELTAEVLLRSKKPLMAVQEAEDEEKKPIPDISPLHKTISIKKYHFYTKQDFFPITGSKYPYLHTIFFGHSKAEVKNLYDGEVNKSQLLGRNLMKSFCAAASQARALYGAGASTLIKPVVVQSVMTDGQYFHFSVFQLNEMNVNDKNATKNVYWSSDLIPLYEKCEYFKGVPTLEGYNPEVFKKIMTLYNHE